MSTFPIVQCMGGRFRIVAVLCVAAVISTGAARAQQCRFDITRDWSDTDNPNGPWTFGDGVGLLPSIADWGFFTPVQPAFARRPVFPNHIPAWLRAVVGNPNPIGSQAGDIMAHSDDGCSGFDTATYALWTSPFSGPVTLSGEIWRAQDAGRGNHWRIYKNDQVLTAGDLPPDGPFTQFFPMPFAAGTGGPGALMGITVAGGDTIRLELQRYAGQCGEFAGMRFTVSRDCGCPTVVGPNAALVCPTGTAAFSVGASGPGPLSYEWQIRLPSGVWQTLGNDPGPIACPGGGDGYAFGTPPNSPMVNIGVRNCAGVQHWQVRCLVGNTCGFAPSNSVTLTICPADFNCDHAVTSQDFFDFLPPFFGSASSADFNRDGIVNSQDFFEFLTAFFVGC